MKVHAQQAHRAHLFDEFAGEVGGFAPLGDVRPDPIIYEGPDPISDRPFLCRQQAIEVEVVVSQGIRHVAIP